MSRFSSFEEALQNLGERWAAFAGELKTALNALITASCEGTEDGRRRALDRANRVTVAGVKRRIEDYTLSLSTPSMVMFGLGILLPLMVGSFLPMLSWDVWSGPEPSLTGDPPDGSGHAIELVFVMNVLFPALGALVAVGSITRHPLARGPRAAEVVQNGHSSPLLLAIGVSIVLVATAVWQLEGIQRVAVALTCSVAPISVALIHLGQGDYLSGSRAETRLEEVLFRTGARMVEGENFESAACSARKGLVTRQRQNSGPFLCRSSSSGAMSSHPSNGPVLDSDALDAFEVVKEASSKDERAAGLLAMDLATYLRDIRETELTLKGRLRPTISMMRITSYALAPVVLAVTFAIYMTLGGMTGSGVGALDCELFFIVLGVFLAESNFVVQYFVWGIEGRKGRGLLMRSIGTCVLTSEIIFVVTALLAS